MEYNIQEVYNNGYKFKFFNGGSLNLEDDEYITISDPVNNSFKTIFNDEIWGYSITANNNTLILFTELGEFVFHYVPIFKKTSLSHYVDYNFEKRLRGYK